MKKDIHPKWYSQARVVCSCGRTFTTGSTVEEIHVEVCSACHPFFTGQMKYVDTAGRVEKFQSKQAKTVVDRTSKKDKKLLKRKKAEEEERSRPKSLGEMLKKRALGE